MPYITPPSTPESTTCRALLIPDSSEWLAIFGGALTELIYKYNWEQVTGITVDDAVQTAITVINGFYDGCAVSGCTLPEGDGIFRINPDTQELEQLVNGEWVEPTGEYTLPPTPARTEPTAEERKCLAAANAAYAFEMMYEELADAYADDLATAEAIVLFVSIIIGIIGGIFGIAITALIALIGSLFGVFYLAFEHLTSDMWDSEFTEKFQCLLYECATDDGEVVHFDMNCALEKMLKASILEWSAPQLLVLLQIGTMVQFLGAQAIDALGATTAVETADCDDCEGGCGLLITFEPEQPWSVVAFGYGASGFVGAYDDDFGDPAPSIRTGTGTDSSSLPGMGLAVEIDLGAETSIFGLEFRYWYERNDIDLIYIQIDWLNDAHGLITTSVITPAESQAEWHGAIFTDDVAGVQYVQIRVTGSGGGFTSGEAYIDNVCVNPPA